MIGILLQAWPALLIAVPLALACLTYLLPRRAAGLAVAACGLNLAVAVGLAWHVASGGPLRHAVGGWAPPLGIGLRVDGLAVLMLLATAAVALAAAVYALAYFRGRGAGRAFWPLWLFLLGGLNALFAAADLFNLYVTLELSGLAAVALVTVSGETAGIAAAVRYLLVGLTGSLCYLLGVALLYGGFGTVDLALLGAATPGPVLAVALALMTAGLLFKAGLFPFHFWLPAAHSNAPAPVSAMLSALVVEAAFYLVLRLWTELAPAALAEQALPVLAVLGGAAVLWGAVNAVVARRLKLMVAYSTVAQLGYLFLVLPLLLGPGTGVWSGMAVLLLAHACAKGAAFLAAGTVLHQAGHDRIHDLGGTAQRLPLTISALILAGVTLIGLPPSGGFLAKWLLLNAAIGAQAWWTVAVLLAGSVLAGAYVFRVVGVTFDHVEEVGPRHRVPAALEWSAFALAAAAILIGLFGSGIATLATVGAPVEGPLLQEMVR